jgi:hypothetical protein
MSYGNLSQRPDLSPLFGPLSREDNARLLDRLIAIDDRSPPLPSKSPHTSAYAIVL